MDDKPRKLLSPFCFVISFAIITALCFGIIALIHNIWRIVAAVTGDAQFIEIFKQLEESVVKPPILIAVLVAVIIGFVLCITRKKKSLMIILIIILVLLSILMLTAFTRVNELPVYAAVTIVSDILKSGVL